jgi:ELWxxDGT repeat protein
MEDATGKNYLYFRATDGTYGTELWRSDGTDSGTTLVKDINTSGNSGPDYLAVMKDTNGTNYLYFSADDGTNGDELWRTDGTTNGTTMVKNISVGTGSTGPGGIMSISSNPKNLTVMKDISEDKNYLYFNARSADPTIDYGEELWRTDGTESGTTMVKEIFVGYNNSDPRELTVMKDISENKNYLYFVANGIYQYYDQEIESQIWRTDGTTTTLIQDIQPNEYYYPMHLTVMKDISDDKNYLYFYANAYIDGDYRDHTGALLWRTDGTKTTLVQDQGINYYNYLFYGSSSDYFNYVREEPFDLTVMDGTSTNVLYFRSLNSNQDNTNGLYRLRISIPISISFKKNNAFVENLETASLQKPQLKTYLKSFYSNNKSSFNNKPVKLEKDTTLNGFTKPFPDKDIFLLDGTNPAKMTKDELVGEQFLVITELNIPVTLPTLMDNIEVKVTETSTDTFQVEKLSSNATIETKTLSSGDSYTLEGLTVTLGSIIGSLVEPVICFKEGTQILTLDLNTGLDTYKNIENINVGDLVSTYKHGYVPVNIIGYSNLINTSNNSRITDKLYVYKKEDHHELIEDLYMTGGHAVLLDYENITDNQCDKMMEEMGKLYKTDDKFRLMAKLDYRCDTVDDNRQYRVWHICLDHENEWMNYGIYANGILVESTCERHAQNFLHKKENVVELIKDHCQLTPLLV